MASDRRVARAVAAGVAALALVATGCTGTDHRPRVQPGWDFASRPDLSPPLIEVSIAGPAGQAAAVDEDLILLAPKGEESPLNGLLIADPHGNPVWVHPLGERSYDLRVQEYRGEPVLTWWRGENLEGHGAGEFVIMDDSYREVATVTTSGTGADFHELTLTDAGTALLVSYPTVPLDLTAVGGPQDGYVLDGVIQEVDLTTGETRFEWRATDHVPVTDSQSDLSEKEDVDGSREAPYDYFHINSVTEDDDGSLLISARHTHAIYRIDRTTGRIDWTLGGPASDFTMGGGASFAWQHDAQRQPDGTISLFDNHSNSPDGDSSRGLKLALDMDTMTATVAQEFHPPAERVSQSQGNMQVRDNGNVVIGWGSQPYYSEYAPDGELLVDAYLGLGEGDNYRAYRLPWRATPAAPPDLAVVAEHSARTAYVSWNGATEVDAWRFLAGEDPASAGPVATVTRTGFETAASVPDAPYVTAQALDESGTVLATAAHRS